MGNSSPFASGVKSSRWQSCVIFAVPQKQRFSRPFFGVIPKSDWPVAAGPLQRERLRMMFICYSITLGMLGLAYQSPDLFVVVVLLIFARTALQSH